MFVRDILGEHLANQKAASVGDAIVAKRRRPQEPTLSPSQLAERTQARLEGLEMIPGAGVIVVDIHNDYLDEMLLTGDTEKIISLQLLQGAYWDTGIQLSGQPVWRSVKIPQGHDRHMHWIFFDGSWWLTDQVFQTKEASEDKANIIAAWGKKRSSVQRTSPPGSTRPFGPKKQTRLWWCGPSGTTLNPSLLRGQSSLPRLRRLKCRRMSSSAKV